MALLFLGVVLSLGGVTPELLAPWFFLGILAAGIWAVRLLSSSESVIKTGPMHWPILGFFIYAVARYATAPIEYEGRLEVFQITLCVLVYFIAANWFRTPVHRKVLIFLLAGLAVFESMYGLWQALSRSDAIFHWTRTHVYRGRASGTFVCPNHLAGCLQIILNLVVARLMLVRSEGVTFERSTLVKVGLVYAAAIAATGIAFSQSRAGWMAAAAGLIVLVFWGRRFSRRLLVGIGLLVLALGIGIAVVGEVGWERIEKTFKRDSSGDLQLVDATLGGRLLMWGGTIGMIRENPIFGTGPGTWQWLFQTRKDDRLVSQPEYAHNDYLNLVSDYGLLGGLLVGWILIAFFRQARFLARRDEPVEQRAFAIGAAAAVSSILVHSVFDFNLHVPGNAVILAAVVGAMAGMDNSTSRYPVRALRSGRFAVAGGIIGVVVTACWFFVPTVVSAHFADVAGGFRRRLEYNAAVHFYRKAVEADPRAPQPLISLGEVYLVQASLRLGPEKAPERLDLTRFAAEAFDQALSLNEHLSAAWLGRGRAYEIAGEDAEAYRSYQQAIKVDPVNPSAYFRIGCHHRDRGELPEAEAAFFRSAQLRHVEDFGAQGNLNEIRSR